MSLKRGGLALCASVVVVMFLAVGIKNTLKSLTEERHEDVADELAKRVDPSSQHKANPYYSAKRVDYNAARDGRRFEHLTPKNQLFVRDHYKALLFAHEKRDFQSMLEHTANILSLIDEYNDTKSYENIAKRGLDAAEEERRRQVLEKRQADIRSQVALLENAGREVAALGFQDSKNRESMSQLIKEIYVKDPNNRLASEWAAQMREIAAEQTRDKVRRNLASLEIKGQALVRKAKKNAEARAELYKVIDGIHALDPQNTFPGEWKKTLHKD